MATMNGLFLLFLLGLLHKCESFGLFDDLLGGTDSCEEICGNSYPLHTYEKGIHLSYCRRGCRLYSIIDFVKDDINTNQTRDSCALSCKESYAEVDDQNACVVGCDAQVNVAKRRRQKLNQLHLEAEHMEDNIYPFMYVHNACSNMADKLWQHMRVRWSLYVQSDNGHVVVVRTQPQYFTEFKPEMLNRMEPDIKTHNYLETNIAALDNSATPNVKHSQMRPLDARDIFEDVTPHSSKTPTELDWLGCIAKKTGMPRMILTSVIFLSAMVMIWLCFTTAATAPDHRVHTQKLSIYGDLDYLKTMDDKALLSSIHPQDVVQAEALPIKIQVQRI